MFQIDNSTAVAARPAPAAVGTPGWATSGNPAQGLLPTSVDADWVNSQQGELESILAAAEIAPDKTQINQVLKSIQALTLKWLGGGVYQGVNFIGNSRTLDTTYAGFLNVLEATPVITLPLADTCARGVPIDFLCHAGGAVIARQGGDTLLLGEGNANSYTCANSDKIRFVSDGGGTWILDQESNLYAPNFRGPTSGVTASPTDNSGKLSTTAFAKNIGLRANAYFEFNQANVAIQPSWVGGLIWNDYYNAGFTLPHASACEANSVITIYAYAPMQLACYGGDSFPGFGTSLALTAGSVFQAVAQPAAPGWRIILDPRVIGGRLQTVSTSSITSVVLQKNFTWQLGQCERVRFEWTGLTSSARGQYEDSGQPVAVEQFDVSIYVAAGGVQYPLTITGGNDIIFEGGKSDGFIEIGPLQSSKPSVTVGLEYYTGARTNGFPAAASTNAPYTVLPFFGDGIPSITEVGLIGVAQNSLAGAATGGVGLNGGAFTVLAR